jgi:hypothetical protein
MSKQPGGDHSSIRQQTSNCLSSVSAHRVIRKALFEGRIEYRSYFCMRMRDRDFNTLDVENVLRFGEIDGPGEHSVKFNNWRYLLHKRIEGYSLAVATAIDADEDVDELPLIIPVTDFWRGEGTRDGKKHKAKNNRNQGRTNQAAGSG